MLREAPAAAQPSAAGGNPSEPPEEEEEGEEEGAAAQRQAAEARRLGQLLAQMVVEHGLGGLRAVELAEMLSAMAKLGLGAHQATQHLLAQVRRKAPRPAPAWNAGSVLVPRVSCAGGWRFLILPSPLVWRRCVSTWWRRGRWRS